MRGTLHIRLFDSKDIDITTLEEDVLDNASYFGRIFARSGGLSDAVAQAMKEQNIDFNLKAVLTKSGTEYFSRLPSVKETRMRRAAHFRGFLGGSAVKNLPAMQET